MRVQVLKINYASNKSIFDGLLEFTNLIIIIYGPLKRIASRDPGGFEEESGLS